MGFAKKMLDEAEDYPEPPREAFSEPERREIDDEWLNTAERQDQINAMRAWFLARYCDPAYETPYSSDAGGYIYVNGGPYNPHDELEDRFAGVADEDAIEEIADELYEQHFDEWAPTTLISYVRAEDVFVDERFQPTQRLEARLDHVRGVLTLEGDEAAKGAARNIVYASVISALETFLWETMVYWVENRDETVKQLVMQHPSFRDQKISLGAIFDVLARLKIEVRTHLQHVVWHRWEQVMPLFKHGLQTILPSVRRFEAAVQARHDIVHRSGQTEDGQPVSKTVEEIEELADQVLAYANQVDRILAAKGLIQGDEPAGLP